jgi:hypothetical protein
MAARQTGDARDLRIANAAVEFDRHGFVAQGLIGPAGVRSVEPAGLVVLAGFAVVRVWVVEIVEDGLPSDHECVYFAERLGALDCLQTFPCSAVFCAAGCDSFEEGAW